MADAEAVLASTEPRDPEWRAAAAQLLAGAPWRRFVALGDSITEGYGVEDVEGFDSLTWAARLEIALREVTPDLVFKNLGWRNLMAHEIRDRQLERALALKPDLVSLLIGLNDILRPDYDVATVRPIVEEVFEAFAQTGATIVTYRPMDITASGLLAPEGVEWLRPRLRSMTDVHAELAERHGAVLVDLWDHPASSDRAHYSSDLKHGNMRGNAVVARETILALSRFLSRVEVA